MGSRYGGLKQVDALGPNDEALIEFSIFDAIRAGFGKVVFVIRKDIEDVFKEKFSNKFDDQIAVHYVFQEMDTPIDGVESFPHREKPWGTAHAVLVAAPVIQEPFAVINADDYYGVSSFQSMSDFLSEACQPDLYAMIGYVLNNTLSDHGAVNRGVAEMDDQHNLTEVVERLKIRRENGKIVFKDEQGQQQTLAPDNLVSMNFWGFHPAIFEHLRNDFVQFVKDNWDHPRAEFFIPLPVSRLIEEGIAKVRVIPSDELWYGVTYQEDKAIVKEAFQKLVEKGVYPEKLWA